MDQQSFQDVVQFALEKEKEAVEFYNECAETSTRPGMKQAFLEMAREGSITINGSPCPLSLVKQYKIQATEPSIAVSWILTSLSDEPLDFMMGGEINFSLLTDMDEGRYLCLNEDTGKKSGILGPASAAGTLRSRRAVHRRNQKEAGDAEKGVSQNLR